jgi:hypothetical protein
MIGALLLLYFGAMIACFAMTGRAKPPPPISPPLKFDEKAIGPWTYFADSIKPPQRKTF